jgi:hypothetical protein
MSNFMKIHSVGAELFHAERQTDRRDEVRVAFLSFSNAPKNAEKPFRKHVFYTPPYISRLVLYIERYFPDSTEGLQIQMLTERLPQGMVE